MLALDGARARSRTRRDIGPVNPQHQHGTAKTPSGHLGDAPINLLPSRRHSHHTEVLRHLVRERVQTLTTDGHPCEPAKEG